MATARAITIRDVAREAGVSITTVSDALNGRGRLPEATRTRVQEIARRLGYHPNSSARRLRRGRTRTIGLYCPMITDVAGGLGGMEYYMRLAMGAAQEAMGHDLALTLLPPAAGGDELARVDVDGLLVADPTRGDPALRGLAARGVPIVTCEHDPTPGAAHAGEVKSDHAAALAELLDHLREAGATRIALIAPRRDTAWGAELQDRYLTWTRAHGAPCLMRDVPMVVIERDVGAATAELLDAPEPPDALVAAPEDGAVGALRVARARGLGVPDDLLLASCVDSAAVAACDPPVTAIDLHPQDLGRTAARRLARVLAGEALDGAPELIPTSLTVRRSTRPAARLS